MTTLKKTSLSDIPFHASVNDFGTERYVNGLIKFIRNSSAPITIALQGEWGSGKTSLMNRLDKALCGPAGDFTGIKINTWEYSMLSTPEVTVVKIIQKLVASLAEPSMKEKVGRFFSKFSRSAIKAGAGVFTNGVEIVDDIFDGLAGQKESDLEQLRTVLEESIEKMLATKGKHGIIVFIDDLDRLNPPVAVEILELLKNIFSLKNCIFVLAIDYEVVVKGLKPKFGELSPANEREFRSFFDKIIQVPFSLPVNNYHPMEFVLDSLVNIGYISIAEKGDPEFKELFGKIVDWSVGKNPRSIKRLINTLSLLDCIAQCGIDNDKFSHSREAKIINFAIVATQVCYPQIYRMLSLQPDFTTWGEDIATRMNLSVERREWGDYKWEEILDAACSLDQFMTQHQNDIDSLLNLIYETGTKDGSGDFEKNIRKIIDKSSVTGISSGVTVQELDRKNVMGKLHSGVLNHIAAVRPDIKNIWTKRNTGNGGFYIKVNAANTLDNVLKLYAEDNKVVCQLWLDCWIRRPEGAGGDVNVAQLLSDERFNNAVETFDRVLTPLLKLWYFSGKEIDGHRFRSYREELLYRHEMDYLGDAISFNPEYWIKLDRPSDYEDAGIVAAIADIIIATYDMRLAALDFASPRQES